MKSRFPNVLPNKFCFNPSFAVANLLSNVGSEFQPPGKKHFCGNDQQHADAGGGNNFDQETDKTAKLQPLQESHIAMMKNGKDKCVNEVGCPAHCFG